MPIGSPSFTSSGQAAASIGGIAGGSAQAQAGYGAAMTSGSIGKAPMALLVVVGLYLFWAVIVQKESIRSQIQPSNVAVNFHNIFVVGLTAMLFLVLGKIASAKLVLLKVPGAATVAQLFQAS